MGGWVHVARGSGISSGRAHTRHATRDRQHWVAQPPTTARAGGLIISVSPPPACLYADLIVRRAVNDDDECVG